MYSHVRGLDDAGQLFHDPQQALLDEPGTVRGARLELLVVHYEPGGNNY